MTQQEIKEIFAENYIGQDELSSIHSSFLFGNTKVPAIPFSDTVLRSCAKTHILIYTPNTYANGSPITINSLRDLFGVDSSTSEPCMYNQDWYIQENFAKNRALDGKWHLIPKNVREDMRAKHPEEIEQSFSANESFTTAITYSFTFFVYWFYSGGKILWKNDFLWCDDFDHNGDRIYVGRYEDPTGINKNGFNIHRQLTLRSSYSTAPEIIESS